MWTEPEYRAVRIAALLTTIAVILWMIFNAVLAHASTPALTLVPADYDEQGVPRGPCQADNVACYPILTLWNDPGPHRQNLVAVKFAFWNPPAPTGFAPMWAPKSHRVAFVSYWSAAPHYPQVGDTLDFAAVSGVIIQPSRGYDADPDTTKVVGGKAWVTAVSDSLVEMRASVRVSSRLWSSDWVDTSFVRLVPERWYRPLAASQP